MGDLGHNSSICPDRESNQKFLIHSSTINHCATLAWQTVLFFTVTFYMAEVVTFSLSKFIKVKLRNQLKIESRCRKYTAIAKLVKVAFESDRCKETLSYWLLLAAFPLYVSCFQKYRLFHASCFYSGCFFSSWKSPPATSCLLQAFSSFIWQVF